MSRRRFALFYPSVELGGAEMLFARLADQLARRGHEVTILDGDKGVIQDNVTEPGVLSRTVEKDAPIVVECDHLIAFASHLHSLRRFVDARSTGQVLFWGVHPLNAVYLPPRVGEKLFAAGVARLRAVNRRFFRAEDEVRGRALRAAMESDAFVCMDGETADVLADYYGIEKPFRFIPVPVSIPDESRNTPSAPRGTDFTLAWFGRLCDFKVYALLDLIARIGELPERDALRLLIIGDGPLRDMVERAAERAGVQACFKGRLPNAQARQVLAQEADLVFAMGTAALEAGTLALPTVLVDASYRPITYPYGYDWLYRTPNFTMGRFVNRHSPLRGMPLAALLKEAREDLAGHGRKTFDYVRTHHDAEHVVDLVEEHTARSTMSLQRFHALTDYRKPFLVRTAIGVRNLLSI